MKVQVDQDLCISCGLCVNDCPTVFDWNEEGKASPASETVPEDDVGCCQEAIENCPTQAINSV